MGLETVSIELDDPFGDDENDFDNLGMALVSKVMKYGMYLYLLLSLSWVGLRCFCFSRYCIPNYKRVVLTYTFLYTYFIFRLPLKIPT